jgi:hypothetical protein
MLEHLFGSKTRLKVLRLFFRHPDQSFFVRELSRDLGSQINAVRRELEILLKADLIKEVEGTEEGKASQGGTLRKYYILNSEAFLFPEIQALLLKAQLLGEQEFINDLKERAGDVKLFVLTGRFTGENHLGSDLLLVGDLKERVIAKCISEYEKEFGFEIRYTTMTEKEFLERRHVMDKFLYSLFEAKNIKVVDEFNF